MYKVVLNLLFIFYTQIEGNVYNHSDIDFSKCRVHYSRSGLVYRDFYSVTESSGGNDTLLLDFHFSVLAPSDAHILLAPSDHIQKGDPAYEIVIGAGGNTFCDIRRRQKSDVKASVRIKGLLSALDPQSFWIHITKDGDIAIGKESEELPFISWLDPDPLPLKVISFSTWSGVEAKWYFDCKIDQLKEIQRPMTAVERLRRDLLYHYDPYARPVHNISTSTNISMAININYIFLDEHRAVLQASGVTKMMWLDEKIIWDPQKYENLQYLHIFRREIWQPDLVLYNALGDARDILEDSLMVVHYTGEVEWNPSIHLKAFCDSHDLGTWPKDSHKCNFILGFMRDFTTTNLIFKKSESSLVYQDTSEWLILNADILSGYTYKEQNDTAEPAIFEMVFTLKRNSILYDWLLFAPFLFMSVSILSSFWIDPFGKLKVSIECSQMVICTIVLLTIAMIAPVHVKRVPYLIALYSYSLVALLGALIVTVIIINLVRGEQQRSVPHLLYKILTNRVVKLALCLPSMEMPDKYGNLDESKENHQSIWILLSITIDRIMFLFYFALTVYAIILNHK